MLIPEDNVSREYLIVLLCHKVISSAIATMTTGTTGQIVGQNDHEFPFYSGNGRGTMPLRPEGWIPAAANLRVLQVT